MSIQSVNDMLRRPRVPAPNQGPVCIPINADAPDLAALPLARCADCANALPAKGMSAGCRVMPVDPARDDALWHWCGGYEPIAEGLQPQAIAGQGTTLYPIG